MKGSENYITGKSFKQLSGPKYGKRKLIWLNFFLDIMIFFVATILAEIVINSANIAFRGAHFLVDFLLVAVLFGGKQIIKNIRK